MRRGNVNDWPLWEWELFCLYQDADTISFEDFKDRLWMYQSVYGSEFMSTYPKEVDKNEKDNLSG